MGSEKVIEATRQFNQLLKIDKFKDIIVKLTLDRDLNEIERTYLLSCSLLFLEEYKKNKKYRSFLNFAYFIILKYSLKYKDYQPLYDFSINFGFYPIAKYLNNFNLIEEKSINDFLIDLELENYNAGNYFETYEQYKKRNDLIFDKSFEKGYIAPTSFGKSSIITEIISKTNKKRIAIIVPTKSLLAQTYKNIKNENFNYKLIVHDEMFDGESSFIGILTQERALRLLAKENTSFDLIFIDEAHNILNYDNRSILLSRLIKKCKNLNNNCEIIYLSPLIDDIENIKINQNQDIKKFKIDFNIKEPEIYELKTNNSLYKYNRFFLTNDKENFNNDLFFLGYFSDKIKYVLENANSKNFLYTFRPKYIEKLSLDISKQTKLVDSEKINSLIELLKKEVHPDFYCVNLLRYGIVYLHGKMPDIIKEYLEYKAKEYDEIKFIVANNVILEGINLPIDSLFIFSTYNLQGKELTNLIGRVNRLNDIFNKSKLSIDKLLPKIHFINNEKGEYSNGNNMFNKIVLLKRSYFNDEIKNPTLSKFDINSIKDTDKVKQEKKRAVIQQLILQENSLSEKPKNFNDKLNKYLFESGIYEYYYNTAELESTITKYSNEKYFESIEWKKMDILNKVQTLFLFKSEIIKKDELRRLTDYASLKFYKNYILISQKKSLKENIESYFNFFKERSKSDDPKKRKFYFGTSYGEEIYDSTNYPDSKKEVYVDLGKVENDVKMINLAIVKLKMEDEFVNFTLNKLIVFLFDFKYITDDEYNLYVYGTIDKTKIKFTKFGLNIGLVTKLENDNQLENITFDEHNNIKTNNKFRTYLNALNDFQRFEIEKFL